MGSPKATVTQTSGRSFSLGPHDKIATSPLRASGQVAQLVERSPEKAGVGGSIPSLATTLRSAFSTLRYPPLLLRPVAPTARIVAKKSLFVSGLLSRTLRLLRPQGV